MTALQHTQINYNGHMVDIAFTYNPHAVNYNRNCNVIESQEYLISGLVLFQIKLECTPNGANQFNGVMTYIYNLRLFVKFNKYFSNDDEAYVVKFNYQGIHGIDRMYFLDDNGWRVAADITIESSCEFLITLKLGLQEVESSFKPLYNDDELTDFELSGVDGSIRVHKLVLAYQSPVMKTMFSGPWKETSSGTSELPDTNKETLQNFKRYLYLKELPVEETEILDLLTLGSYYMMSDLKKKCVFNLLDHLSSKNAFNYLEIAIKCRLKKLLLVIMECIRNDIIKTQDIDENCSFEEIY